MKTPVAITASVAATALAVSGWTAFLMLPATVHTVTRTKTITVTVTKTPKPVTVTRWRTRTVTRQGSPAVPCQDIGGSPEPGVLTQGLPGDTTCAVTLVSPMGANHLAQIQLTAPNGDNSLWSLTNG